MDMTYGRISPTGGRSGHVHIADDVIGVVVADERNLDGGRPDTVFGGMPVIDGGTV